MTDNELDAILNEIEKRANAQAPLDPPEPSHHVNEPAVDDTKVIEPKETNPLIDIDNLNIDDVIKTPLLDLEPTADSTDSTDAQSEAEEMVSLTDDEYNELADDDADSDGKDKKNNKKPLIIALIVLVIIAIGVGVYFGFFAKDKPQPTNKPTTTQATTIATTVVDKKRGPINPLTGETGYNEAALGKRPVAVVVENEYSTESVRPQWGINKADILLEGESEYSTRLLLFFADYTNMPEQIGPTRSARPPFINFSQLFDSVFIHAGLSHTKGNYVGADTVFKSKGVDHYNLLKGAEDGHFFGRDYSRTSTIEHTGFLNGTNVEELLTKRNINTDLDTAKFSVLNFNEEAAPISETPAESLEFIWSDVYSSGKCPKTGHYSYNSEKQIYTTNDFDSSYGTADLEFANLVFLLDETEYVVKENYKGSGNSETYCNYGLDGGKGVVASMGTKIDITWGVTDGRLWMKDAEGKDVVLNPGKTYIGYGSSNHGGNVKVVDSAQSNN